MRLTVAWGVFNGADGCNKPSVKCYGRRGQTSVMSLNTYRNEK